MSILIMRVAQTKALVLDLTAPAASKGKKRRIATYPLLTTRGFHQWRFGIATEPAMLASNWFGFHTVVCHRVTFWGAMTPSPSMVLALQVHHTANRSMVGAHLHLNPRRPLWPIVGAGEPT